MAPEGEVGDRPARSSLSPGYGDAVVVARRSRGEKAPTSSAKSVEVALARRVPRRAAGSPPTIDRLGRLELADDERHQVGRHAGWCRRSGTVRPARVRRARSRRLGGVRDGGRPSATTRVTAKTALRAGSSQHGKARRASVASNWVAAMTCAAPSASLKRAAVEAVEPVVQDAGEAQGQPVLTRRERRREEQAGALGRLVERRRSPRPSCRRRVDHARPTGS